LIKSCPDLFAIGRYYEAASDANFRLVQIATDGTNRLRNLTAGRRHAIYAGDRWLVRASLESELIYI
jgi:hypothetical protein